MYFLLRRRENFTKTKTQTKVQFEGIDMNVVLIYLLVRLGK